jgi:hypothetical protein
MIFNNDHEKNDCSNLKSLRPRCYVTGQATVGFNQVNSPSYPKPAGGNSECLYV